MLESTSPRFDISWDFFLSPYKKVKNFGNKNTYEDYKVKIIASKLHRI